MNTPKEQFEENYSNAGIRQVPADNRAMHVPPLSSVSNIAKEPQSADNVLSSNTTGVVNYLNGLSIRNSIIVPHKKILANGVTTGIFTLYIPTTEFSGGAIRWTVTTTNGTDHQNRTGITTWSLVNKATTYTSQVTEIGGSIASSSGTLTGTWSITTSGNIITLKFTPTSSLTTTNITLYAEADSLNFQPLIRI
jgi:hypothetical protein